MQEKSSQCPPPHNQTKPKQSSNYQEISIEIII